MKQFRTFSEEHNQMSLDKELLFAYAFFDGFSQRGLRAEFVVDYEYTYVLELEAFQHQKLTNNNSDTIISKGKLSGKELEFMEALLSLDYNSLKQEYNFETFDVTDVGVQQFFINLDKTTKYVHILGGLPKEYFTTKVELKLFEFNEYMKNLIETTYENWVLKK